MEQVIKNAKEISVKDKIPLYLSESEIRRLDREEALQEGYDAGYDTCKQDMIMNFYKNNISLDIISDATNLSLDEIKKVIEENK